MQHMYVTSNTRGCHIDPGAFVEPLVSQGAAVRSLPSVSSSSLMAGRTAHSQPGFCLTLLSSVDHAELSSAC